MTNCTVKEAFSETEVWPLVHVLVPFTVACYISGGNGYSGANADGLFGEETSKLKKRFLKTFLPFFALIYLFETVEYLLGEKWEFWAECQADRMLLDPAMALLAYCIHLAFHAVSKETRPRNVIFNVLFTPVVFSTIKWLAKDEDFKGWDFPLLGAVYALSNLLVASTQGDNKDECNSLWRISAIGFLFCVVTGLFWLAVDHITVIAILSSTASFLLLLWLFPLLRDVHAGEIVCCKRKNGIGL
jgi:hypothetical protein